MAACPGSMELEDTRIYSFLLLVRLWPLCHLPTAAPERSIRSGSGKLSGKDGVVDGHGTVECCIYCKLDIYAWNLDHDLTIKFYLDGRH